MSSTLPLSGSNAFSQRRPGVPAYYPATLLKIYLYGYPNRGHRIFKPEFKFGLGGVPLGTEFNKHTDKEAETARGEKIIIPVLVVQKMSETPFRQTKAVPRRNVIVTHEVGKLFKASKTNRHAEVFPMSDSPNDLFIDSTPDGVGWSIEIKGRSRAV